MNQQLQEQILACPTLPTLPMVAVRVLQLATDPNVSIRDVAEVIEKDQGLSAKVLRTVNSPLYGLRQRCGSISRALVMMGLGPVKSLAVGFSLVSAVNDDSDLKFVTSGTGGEVSSRRRRRGSSRMNWASRSPTRPFLGACSRT